MKSFLKILFAPFLWVLQACNPLGEPVDEEISENHYYNGSRTDVIYSPMGNWFELGKTPMQVDVESFRPLNHFLSKDRQRVYYEAYPIEHKDLDVDIFYTRGDDYMANIGLDNENVYVVHTSIERGDYKAIASVVENADPSTFRQMDTNWGKDKAHHFYRYKILEADYKSFKNLNPYFSMDKERAYYHFNDGINSFAVDTETFKPMGDSYYAYDKDNVYCFSIYVGGKEINQLITIPYEGGEGLALYNTQYLKCGDKVFYSGFELMEANADEFQAISDFYGKDGQHVFYENKILEGADAKTFHLSEEQYGVFDKNGRYVKGKLVVDKKDQN